MAAWTSAGPSFSGCSSSLTPSGCLSRCFRGSHPPKPSQPSDVDGSIAHKTPPPPDGKNANRGPNREDCPLREASPQQLPDTGFPGPLSPTSSPHSGHISAPNPLTVPRRAASQSLDGFTTPTPRADIWVTAEISIQRRRCGNGAPSLPWREIPARRSKDDPGSVAKALTSETYPQPCESETHVLIHPGEGCGSHALSSFPAVAPSCFS